MSSTVHALKYDITVAGINYSLNGVVPVHAFTYMLKIHGPTYRYSGEILTKPELILVEDHHYDEELGCDHVAMLVNNSACQHVVCFDHVVAQDQFDFECEYFPTLLARECVEFDQQQIQPNWHNKTHAFNFMINKPRPHRLLLLQIIDELKLTNYRHSLCWNQSPVDGVATTDYRIGNELVMQRGFRGGSYLNAETYKILLKENVFEPTAVSLITEPAYHERETIVTEKTIMSIYGGTVPVWVGGWRIADYMKDLGFDVFDDMVDHGYQSLPDPEQRCLRAVLDNQHLLHHPVQADPARLQHNLDLLRSMPWLDQVKDLIKTYPDLQTSLPTSLLCYQKI